MWMRVPYLWKSPSREFFNPFDHGIRHNLYEAFLTPLRVQKSDLSHEVDALDYQSQEQADEGDEESGAQTGKGNNVLSAPRYYINWNTAKIYNIKDISWSPMFTYANSQLRKDRHKMAEVQKKMMEERKNALLERFEREIQ